jgi:1,4-alpha-glucan branching enzyme
MEPEKKPTSKKVSTKKKQKENNTQQITLAIPVTADLATASSTAEKAASKTKATRTKKGMAVKYEDVHFVDSTKPVWNYSLFSEEAIANFQRGTLYNAYQYFGAHQATVLGKQGYYFSVWAPNATAISVVGNFNDWQPHSHPLMVRLDRSGIWEGFIPNLGDSEIYKYHIIGYDGAELYKGDPFAAFWEKRPKTASVTYTSQYNWKDNKWMRRRKEVNSLECPWTVYEVHLTSWMRPDPNNEETYNTYQQIQEQLVPYVKNMGFTHVEFMPVMEHPFDGSWGYQGTGYFAPTSRFGTPDEFRQLVDAFHQEGIGVILDWVPSHFPYDSHGLFMFDGTHTYEYADMRKGYHPDWNSYIFNYKRAEVRCFLISSARYWLEQFHADGLRVDAVSSLLKLDYSREEGEWEPNEFGGNGNLEAISLVKELNETIYRDFSDVQMIAEESTDWPGVSRPTFQDGLGFGMKWMMGWMHDTLDYFKTHPYERRHVQDKFSFSMAYYYDENFMLPISHDEVVHGKSPLLYKMPGDEWQKFANMRLLFTYMFTHPGGKLLFMGSEFGATKEWNYKSELQWFLLQHDPHRKLKDCLKAILHLVKEEPAFYENQFKPEGFQWIELNRREECIIAYRRMGKNPKDDVLVVFNMLPEPKHNVSIYATGKKQWKEIFNSDSEKYWGTGDVFNPSVDTQLLNKKSAEYELKLHLPPLGAIILK